MTTSRTTDEEQLVGVGELVQALGTRPHCVTYILASRGVRETRRVGNFRLFPKKATLKLLRKELADIKARRPGPQPAA